MNNCIYCDICYDGNVDGSFKLLCLGCLERILDKSLYKNINPLENYKIQYNKIKCELCCQSHTLHAEVILCENHKSCFKSDRYDDSDYDYDSDCNDYYEINNSKLSEIENELSQMLKQSKLTYKKYIQKDSWCQYPPTHIFIYQNDRIVCKFIYYYCKLILILDNKIYTTSNCDEIFRKMYFGCKYTFLEINEILNKFKTHFNIKYTLTKNFDDDIMPDHLVRSLVDRFDILKNPLFTYKFKWRECNQCDLYYNEANFFNNLVEKIRIIYNDTTLTVWLINKNRVYTNDKNCLHFYHNSEVQYKSHLEIYKLILNYPNDK
jgi:hypothetical protein